MRPKTRFSSGMTRCWKNDHEWAAPLATTGAAALAPATVAEPARRSTPPVEAASGPPLGVEPEFGSITKVIAIASVVGGQ